MSFLILLVYQTYPASCKVLSNIDEVSGESQPVSVVRNQVGETFLFPKSPEGQGEKGPGQVPLPEEITGGRIEDELLEDELEEYRQDPFSFLDAPGTSTNELGSGFDYGTYHQRLRILDEYRGQINDALETALQLHVTMPVTEIENLLWQSDVQKSRFESHYYRGETFAAEESWLKAQEKLLEALTLSSSSPRIEGRAIWLDRGSIVDAGNPAGLARLMQKLHKAGINVVYFETINAGFPIYPSNLTPPNPLVTGWDPLQTAIDEGHKLGMEVHAWVWVFAVGNKRHNPIVGMPDDYPGPVLSEAGDGAGLMSEALRGSRGNLLPGGRQYEYWLSPASPKARRFLKDLFAEIVTRYDVDGLQLDYIRYPFQKSNDQMGYEPAGVKRFRASTGIDLRRKRLSDHDKKTWIAWKTYQVSSFVEEVSSLLKSIRPDLKLSAAVFPMARTSRILAIQQDWETWIDNGWLDTLSPMSYTTSPRKLQRTFSYVNNAAGNKVLVYPGIAIHRLDAAELLRQVDAIRERGALGSTLFAMAHLNDDKIDALGQGPYKYKRAIPPHQDPRKALVFILENYRGKFATLLDAGDLADLSPETIEGIQASLHALLDVTRRIDAAGGPVDAASLTRLQAENDQLAAHTAAWLERQRAAHPFRARHFDELLVRLDEMLSYITGRQR